MQLSLFNTVDPVLEAAKRLIRAYVLRGDSPDSLAFMGMSYCDGPKVDIGGYLGNKRYDNSKILVFRDINGTPVETVLSKQLVIDEIKKELKK